MITDILEREEVSLVIPTQEELNHELNESAEAIVLKSVAELCYTPPSVSVKRQALSNLLYGAKKVNKTLAQVLKEIGVKPFTPTSVKKYKYSVLHPSIFKAPLFYLFMVSLIAGATTLLFYHSSLQKPWIVLCVVAGAFGLAGIFSLLICNLFENEHRWVTVPLRNYNKDIPFFALEKIAEIRARCPQASYSIDELVEIRGEAYPDPFLIVRLEATNESYYIEVWNEPNYKQERMK